jgi:uncharacterized protein with ATP-grasp and redox domains
MAELVHGRASTYNNYKCRCDECRKAWADYIREGGYVRRYQEKKRQERLTKQKESATIPNILDNGVEMNVIDLRDPEKREQFLEALKKHGVPTTDDGEGGEESSNTW